MLTSSQITLNPGAHLEFVNNTGGYDVYTVYLEIFMGLIFCRRQD